MAFFPIMPGPGGEDFLTQNPFDFATPNHVPILLAPGDAPLPVPGAMGGPVNVTATIVNQFAANLPGPAQALFIARIHHYYNLGQEVSIHIATANQQPVAVYVRTNPPGMAGLGAESGRRVWPTMGDLIWPQ